MRKHDEVLIYADLYLVLVNSKVLLLTVSQLFHDTKLKSSSDGYLDSRTSHYKLKYGR